MTIMEALEKIDALKHNAYSQQEKITWLSRLDAMVKAQIIDTHQGGEQVDFQGYGPQTPLDTVLLAPEPFDEMYLHWLGAQMDYHNGEADRYNAAIVLFNAVYDGFANYYNRTRMAKGRAWRYF